MQNMQAHTSNSHEQKQAYFEQGHAAVSATIYQLDLAVCGRNHSTAVHQSDNGGIKFSIGAMGLRIEPFPEHLDQREQYRREDSTSPPHDLPSTSAAACT